MELINGLQLKDIEIFVVIGLIWVWIIYEGRQDSQRDKKDREFFEKLKRDREKSERTPIKK